MNEEIRKYNLAATPTMDVKVAVQKPVHGGCIEQKRLAGMDDSNTVRTTMQTPVELKGIDDTKDPDCKQPRCAEDDCQSPQQTLVEAEEQPVSLPATGIVAESTQSTDEGKGSCILLKGTGVKVLPRVALHLQR